MTNYRVESSSGRAARKMRLALILGLAGGVSLGPEHPIMTVNIALAVAIGARLLPRVNRMEWTILASAGTIGALFGTPVAAALIFSQTLNGSGEVPLWDRLFAPGIAEALLATAIGLVAAIPAVVIY
ncbi:MotA/TolQ/ExbB proton channel family protein, partial [Escherichia sp. R-CC3]